MEKDGNYSGSIPGLGYNSLEVQTHNQQQEKMKSHVIGSTSSDHHHNNNQIVDYVLNNPTVQQPEFYNSNSFDKLSFADVMQFADLVPKLVLNQTKTTADDGNGNIDPVYFLKFPVLNDHHHNNNNHLSLMASSQPPGDMNQGMEDKDHHETRPVEENNTSVQLRFLDENMEKGPMAEANNKSKRKRPKTVKTSEEVESQRMTHIAVERNRRKQMNEHLRVLRSLMPSSYVQRGDQASIIGGAIEFVRELEQLLQCLESQKRRRLYGDGHRPVGDPSSMVVQSQSQPTSAPLMFPPPMPIPNDQQVTIVEYETGLGEETAESKSCLADVEVRLLGFDALIKILSRRRPGQLIKTIDALEDMQLNILHTNITTIEQTVLYSFNVKIGGEARFTAEDMASSVQKIFSFTHASSSI